MEQAFKEIENDGLGDWRSAAVVRLAHDIPAAFPGGPAHKAGAVGRVVAMVDVKGVNYLAFDLPSATSLALSAASRAGARATTLRAQLQTADVFGPEGYGKSVSQSSIPTLFDYFQESVVAAVFAFLAIESFSNLIISQKLIGTFQLERRNGPEHLTAQQVERRISTEEKVATVLPRLTNKPTIKGTSLWQAAFRKLRTPVTLQCTSKQATSTLAVASWKENICISVY